MFPVFFAVLASHPTLLGAGPRDDQPPLLMLVLTLCLRKKKSSRRLAYTKELYDGTFASSQLSPHFAVLLQMAHMAVHWPLRSSMAPLERPTASSQAAIEV